MLLPVSSVERKAGWKVDRKRNQLLLFGIKVNCRQSLGTMLRGLAFFIVLLLTGSSAGAATLNVVGGELLGASGVIVDGSSYDVAFVDGTCIDLYGGCDDASDFTFTTNAAASLAAQALLDQVFVGMFDTMPELTQGCYDLYLCYAAIPFASDGISFSDIATANRVDESGDLFFPYGAIISHDTAIEAAVVYAVWAPVPEPGISILMGLGLLALGVRNGRDS